MNTVAQQIAINDELIRNQYRELLDSYWEYIQLNMHAVGLSWMDFL